MPSAPLPLPELARVRRYEAAGFRAWPAAYTHYDGTWVVRLTAGHPAKRLNSVNPLDPADVADLPARIERCARRFEAAERPLLFRLSPLSGAKLSQHLDVLGWTSFDPSLVYSLALDEHVVDGALDHIPLKDAGRFVSASLAISGQDPALHSGLADVIAAIQPEAGLFVLERDERPVAAAVCVHDGDLAGLFEVATTASERGRGHGRRILLSALKWARLRGAREAWLQVGGDNAAAIGLYERIGFKPVYSYHYRQPPQA